jgi:outer membrane receptor for ferrienterochelin and colicin
MASLKKAKQSFRVKLEKLKKNQLDNVRRKLAINVGHDRVEEEAELDRLEFKLKATYDYNHGLKYTKITQEGLNELRKIPKYPVMSKTEWKQFEFAVRKERDHQYQYLSDGFGWRRSAKHLNHFTIK